MVRKTVKEIRENMRGGNGKAEIEHIITKEEMNGHGRLYARIRLSPGSSIGFHEHIGDTEPYFILEGHGVFVDNDHSRTEVGPGDVCCIEVGQGHAIENNSSEEDLVFMALIYNE